MAIFEVISANFGIVQFRFDMAAWDRSLTFTYPAGFFLANISRVNWEHGILHAFASVKQKLTLPIRSTFLLQIVAAV